MVTVESKTIGIQDLQRKALELLRQNDQLEHGTAHEFLKYIGDNYDHLVPQAAAAADRFLEALKPDIERRFKEMLDSGETRQAKRLHARLMRNWDAAGLIGAQGLG